MDGLHSSFIAVALIAETLKSTLCRGDIEAAAGWSSQTTTSAPVRSSQEKLHETNPTTQRHIPGALHPPHITTESPMIAKILTPGRSMHPLIIDCCTTPLLNGEAYRTTEPRRSIADPKTRTPKQHGHSALNARQERGSRIFPTLTKTCRTQLQPEKSSNSITAPKRRLTFKLKVQFLASQLECHFS
ncbi:hypothetical protein MTO96_026431 [Rhipicephalus appendiculatus]